MGISRAEDWPWPWLMAGRHDMTTPQYDLAGEVLTQAKLVQALEQEQEQHPAHRWGSQTLKKHRRRGRAGRGDRERQRCCITGRIDIGRPFCLCLRSCSSSAALRISSPPNRTSVAALRGDNEPGLDWL